MKQLQLFAFIPVLLFTIGCATGSDIDAGGYFSTGMTLSSADSAQMKNHVDLRNEINEDISVNGALLMGSKPANMCEEFIGPRRIH